MTGTFVRRDFTSIEARIPSAFVARNIARKSSVEFNWQLAARYGWIISISFFAVWYIEV